MGAMTIAFVAVAVLALALIVVPRIQRARRSRVRPSARRRGGVVMATAGAAPPSTAAACPRLDALPGRDLPGGLRVARAERRADRMKGLAKLDAMPPSYALHLPRCRSVHTVGMRFPLDLIWLGKDGRPVRIDRAVPSNRMTLCLRARSVVEANAGTADGFLAAGL